MTNKTTLNKITSKLLWVLIIICTISMSLFCLTACGGSNSNSSNDKDSSYTKVENDTAIIANGSFEFGSADLSVEKFPQTSTTGWTKANDNSSLSSYVNSGIVNTEASAWKTLLGVLYDNSNFLSFAKEKIGLTDEQITTIKDELKTANPEATSTEISELLKEKIVEEYLDKPNAFPTPSVPTGATGTKVYMLNNYNDSSYFGYGTAQKVTSSSAIALEKGQYGKISLWINTRDLSYTSEKGGVNIRLSNSFNSSNQADYVIYGIDTDGEWKQFEFYVKADKDFDCSISVVVGLGLGGSNMYFGQDYVEGTAFIDDVVFEQIDEADLPANIITSVMELNGEDTIYQNINTLNANEYALYDMGLASSVDTYNAGYFTDVNLGSNVTATGDFTKSNTKNAGGEYITSKNIIPTSTGSLTTNGNGFTVSVTDSSWTVRLTSPKFEIPTESYTLLSFIIENNLSEFDANGVKVFVYDYVDINNPQKITSALTFTTVGENTRCDILVKNNFKTGNSRNFFVDVVVGPTSIKDLTSKVDFSTGEVTISNMKMATGYIYQFKKGVSPKEETDNYDLYSFFSTIADSVVSLYAGETEQYAEDPTKTYAFTPSATELGKLPFEPTRIKSYTGVDALSQYVHPEANTTNTLTNVRTGADGDGNGNHAGLINTKYLSNSGYIAFGAEIANKLNYNDINNPIQPVMIYNSNKADYGHYGFIGQTISVKASSYASISVKVKALDDAKAYIYLVDTSKADKSILTLNDFTVNTDGYNNITNGQEFTNNELYVEVVNDENYLAQADSNGWLTVTFYIATGASAKDFRIELWNGGRDGSSETASEGFVFFDMDTTAIVTADAFVEIDNWTNAFTSSDSVLFGKIANSTALYERVLDDEEKKFNSQQTDVDKIIAYDAKYVWAKGSNFVYAIFNSIDPVAVDPNPTPDDSATGAGCAQTDPASFWMSLSSILLAVALIFAIFMLVVRNLKRKRKANANDAKSHYKVRSRYSALTRAEALKKKVKEESYDDYEELSTEPEERVEEEPITEETEPSLDEYVYGDVQDFGSDDSYETNEESKENND